MLPQILINVKTGDKNNEFTLSINAIEIWRRLCTIMKPGQTKTITLIRLNKTIKENLSYGQKKTAVKELREKGIIETQQHTTYGTTHIIKPTKYTLKHKHPDS